MLNPARLIMLASMTFTCWANVAGHGGRRSGGSGWLTLARTTSDATFTPVTVCIGGYFGGVGALFGYMLLTFQIVVVPIACVDDALARWLGRT